MSICMSLMQYSWRCKWGCFQLFLGGLKLGVLVNFLSHPVVVGFTNAAAIIIGSSQLSKIFGVTAEKGGTPV